MTSPASLLPRDPLAGIALAYRLRVAVPAEHRQEYGHPEWWLGLRGANLGGANLRGADLRGARGIRSAGPVGAEGRIIYAVAHEDGPRFQAGCFWGARLELEAAILDRYADGTGREEYRDDYLAAVAWCAGVRA